MKLSNLLLILDILALLAYMVFGNDSEIWGNYFFIINSIVVLTAFKNKARLKDKLALFLENIIKAIYFSIILFTFLSFFIEISGCGYWATATTLFLILTISIYEKLVKR